MRKLVKLCRYGKLLGLLALPGLIWELPLLDYFWLFWLLGLVEICYNFPVFVQSVKIVIGMVIVAFKYDGKLPDKEHPGCDIKFSLPFDGSWAVVNGGVDKEASHSWDIPIQRYAYDFILLDATGRSFCGEQTEVSSYYCYGRDLLAPADGVVVGLLDGQPDSIIDGKGSADCTAHDIRGNHIVIKHDADCFSLLAHLKSGSLRVKIGESLRRGQPIAQCGNSGNSSEPHLHFQIQNGADFYRAVGLPICFENIRTQPCPAYASYDPRPIKIATAGSNHITRGQLVSNQAEPNNSQAGDDISITKEG